jgi:hypothetical protein
MGRAQDDDREPLLTIVRGSPGEEEIAAVTIALIAAGRASPDGPAPSPPAPRWAAVRGYRPPGAWTSR